MEFGVGFIFRIRFVLIITALGIGFLYPWQHHAYASSRIIINKGTNQLALFKDQYLLDVFPVATGRLSHYTPEGNWRVIAKLVYPSWRNPDGGPIIPGGVPENPLGPRWLGLNALGTGGSIYGIHGNNNPSSVGTYATSGCIRLYNQDILWLYERVPLGTEVQIVNNHTNLSDWKKFNCLIVNGEELKYPPHPSLVHDGETTFLPLRAAAEALGYRVGWNNTTKTVTVSGREHETVFTIGINRVKVNNVTYITEKAPCLLYNTTFVPAFYLQRFLQSEVCYNNAAKLIEIKPTDRTVNNSLT
jgi:hypothetical protein